ncbi:MAG: GNAT family N-acetyltransferase [Rhodomicrobium sp.]|nr:GNAT family N-acetyltransferase [Rhodomicrobium sp.]
MRAASASDEPGWRALWDAYCAFYAVSIPADVTDALWRRILDPGVPVHALVAEATAGQAQTELTGFANYVLHPFTWGTELICYLEDLFVAGHARGAGAGRALIGALVGLAKENGWPRVYWHTHELNEAARSLYGKITPRDPFVRYVVKLR